MVLIAVAMCREIHSSLHEVVSSHEHHMPIKSIPNNQNTPQAPCTEPWRNGSKQADVNPKQNLATALPYKLQSHWDTLALREVRCILHVETLLSLFTTYWKQFCVKQRYRDEQRLDPAIGTFSLTLSLRRGSNLEFPGYNQ